MALLKTRLIIKLLTGSRLSVKKSFLLLGIDLLVGMFLFQIFYLIFYVASLYVNFRTTYRLFPGADPYNFLVSFDILIMLMFLTFPSYPAGTFFTFLTHSHAIPLFLITMLIPLFLTSVFFYASMMPSIWLWLFVAAGLASRLLGKIYPQALIVLDFEQNPLRTLGLVLAIALSFIWLMLGAAAYVYAEGVLRLLGVR